MSELKDWRGTPIEVGSTIIYPGRQGSSVWVNEGEVLAISTNESRIWHRSAELTVRRIRDSHGWGREEKVVYVYALERVTVLQ